MKKTTNAEYCALLHNHNPRLTILTPFTGYNNYITVQDTDGIIYKTCPRGLLTNGHPSIRTAIDKTKAVNTRIAKILPGIKLIEPYTDGRVKHLFEDELGIKYMVKPESVLQGNRPSIETAVDKTSAFIIKAKSIHGDFYDYSNVTYTNDKCQVDINCPIHGVFKQRPNNHLTQSQGCPNCNNTRGWTKSEWVRFCSNKLCTLYIIKCYSEVEEFIKIGITSTNIENRFKGNKTMPYSYKVIKQLSGTPEKIWDLEQKYQQKLRGYRYRPQFKFKGATECYNINSLKIINDGNNTPFKGS